LPGTPSGVILRSSRDAEARMDDGRYGEWQEMARAPRDGTRVLVQIKASEQGEAGVDMARWTRPERGAEPFWVSAESPPGAAIVYAEAELSGWMPLPSPMPRRLKREIAARRQSVESDGSGI
jgi:hypothetical protein